MDDISSEENHLESQFTFSDSDLDEIESQPRHRPRETLAALCRLTRFSECEIKRIYRGFKAECPSGIVQEDTFRDIYAQFFPQGGRSRFSPLAVLHQSLEYKIEYIKRKTRLVW